MAAKKHSSLHETLAAIGRGPDIFRRDTPDLLNTLDNIEEINRDLKNGIYDRRKSVRGFVDVQIARDEGADIFDTIKDDEK